MMRFSLQKNQSTVCRALAEHSIWGGHLLSLLFLIRNEAYGNRGNIKRLERASLLIQIFGLCFIVHNSLSSGLRQNCSNKPKPIPLPIVNI